MRKQPHLKFHKERGYATKPREQEASAAMTFNKTNICIHLSLGVCPCLTTQTHTSGSSSKNVCTHLSMSVCPCTHTSDSSTKNSCSHLSTSVCPCVTTETHASYSSSNKKRKHGHKDSIAARKRAYNDVERRWGYSMDLTLYDDPWKIKKVLQESDLGNMSILLLAKDLAENLLLPVLGTDVQRDAETDRGIQVTFWDMDTKTKHFLVFKRWGSSRSYVFIGKWVQDFVKRRDLKIGDEIGRHWDSYKNHFDFIVLQAN